MATWPDMVRIMCGYTRYRRRCTINLTKTVNIELKLLTAIACLLDVVRRERRWRCASWSMTGDGIGDDSLIQNRMHRLCHKCGSEDQLQERLWPCVDELDEHLPPGRSWCRRPPSPRHTPPATLLYRPPVSLTEQEELSTSSMLPSVDQRSASSGLQQLAVPAATLLDHTWLQPKLWQPNECELSVVLLQLTRYTKYLLSYILTYRLCRKYWLQLCLTVSRHCTSVTDEVDKWKQFP